MVRKLVLLLSSVLVTAGCGGSGNGTPPDGDQERLSHEELNREASAICDRIDEQIDALEDPQSDEEFLDFSAQVIEISDRGIADLKALTPPVSDEQSYARMITAMESAVAATRNVQARLREGDVAGAEDANVEFERASAEFDRLARELDLTGCGQSVDS